VLLGLLGKGFQAQRHTNGASGGCGVDSRRRPTKNQAWWAQLGGTHDGDLDQGSFTSRSLVDPWNSLCLTVSV
jgi:hypothetical protein